MNDGTVTWAIGRSLSVNGGAMVGTIISRINNNDKLSLFGGIDVNGGGSLQLWGTLRKAPFTGKWKLTGISDSQTYSELIGDATSLIFNVDTSTSHVSYDVKGSAIVAKLLNQSGNNFSNYVKKASGELVQWGRIYSTAPAGETITNTLTLTFPINFSGASYAITTGYAITDINSKVFIGLGDRTAQSIPFKVRSEMATDDKHGFFVYWIAIGN